MNRPVGTVTFLFTDVEGSTRAWEAHPAETQTALKRHDEIVAREIEANNGALILERGEGDSVFAVFARAADAVAAAVEIQRALRAQTWPVDVPMRVRMAIHTGEAGADYRGPHVNRAARLRAIAHGEQILISGVTAGILRDAYRPVRRSLSWDAIVCAIFLSWSTSFNSRIRSCALTFRHSNRLPVSGRTCRFN
jgi:class 3 adenylate cyclase